MHMMPRLYRVDHALIIRHGRDGMAVAVPYIALRGHKTHSDPVLDIGLR
jgi:hypothetical protein